MDFLYYKFDTLGLSLAIALGCLIFLQILHFIIVYGRTAFYKGSKKVNDKLYSVSVVLCVKNEAHSLQQRLPTILEQQYPNFEVVVVNDASQDETEYTLRVLQEIYPHLKVVNLPVSVNNFHGKKFPLSIGIKSAKNEIILLTEADSIPTSYDWISEIVKGFTENKEIVLGYNAYEKKAGLLNAFIQFENQTISMNYLGYAMLGNPYMGIGKNLAYKRSLFFENGGFISHYNIPVGDDDLFVNKVAKPKNTSVVLSSDSIILSSAKTRYYDWVMQKKKYYSSLKHFKFKDRFLTSLLPVSTFFLYLLVAASIVLGVPWQYVVVALLIRYIFQIICYYRASLVLGTKKIAIFAPLFELFFLFYNTIIRITTLLTKKKRWK